MEIRRKVSKVIVSLCMSPILWKHQVVPKHITQWSSINFGWFLFHLYAVLVHNLLTDHNTEVEVQCPKLLSLLRDKNMLKNNHILCSPLFENLNQITFDSTATSSCTLSIDHNGLHCSELVLNCMLSPSGVSLMMI